MKSLLTVLTGPEKWTKDAMAKTKEDVVCAPTSLDAYKFCILGAVTKIVNDEYPEISFEVGERIRKQIKQHIPNKDIFKAEIIEFNDDPGTTFEDIVELIKKAGV